MDTPALDAEVFTAYQSDPESVLYEPLVTEDVLGSTVTLDSTITHIGISNV
jgi:hypothetical protein